MLFLLQVSAFAVKLSRKPKNSLPYGERDYDRPVVKERYTSMAAQTLIEQNIMNAIPETRNGKVKKFDMKMPEATRGFKMGKTFLRDDESEAKIHDMLLVKQQELAAEGNKYVRVKVKSQVKIDEGTQLDQMSNIQCVFGILLSVFFLVCLIERCVRCPTKSRNDENTSLFEHADLQ